MWQQISQQIFFRELYLIIVKPWSCWQKDYLLLTGPGISPQVYDRTPCPAVLISEGVLSYINQVSYNLAMWSSLLHYCTLPKEAFFPHQFRKEEDISGSSIEKRVYWYILKISRVLPVPTGRVVINIAPICR